MLMESNQAQVIRQDLRNFSGAVQNMVQGVRAASISWGDQNYQMLFRSIQGLSTKSKRVLDSGNRAAQAAETGSDSGVWISWKPRSNGTCPVRCGPFSAC